MASRWSFKVQNSSNGEEAAEMKKEVHPGELSSSSYDKSLPCKSRVSHKTLRIIWSLRNIKTACVTHMTKFLSQINMQYRILPIYLDI